MRGRRALTDQDVIELCDLYRWGARTSDLCILYGVHRRTLGQYMARGDVPMRRSGRPTVVEIKAHGSKGTHTKSSRPTIPEGVRVVDGDQAPDRLLRSSARALQDKRTAERQSDASNHSCPEEAFECRYAFLRSGNLLRDHE